MNPPEWEQVSVGFLERRTQRRKAEGNADHLSTFVFQYGNQFWVSDCEIIVHHVVDFVLGKGDEVEDVPITLVDDSKKILSVPFHFRLAPEFMEMDLAVFCDSVAKAVDFLRDFQYLNLVLHVVNLFLQTELFDKLRIVRVIVICLNGGSLIEPLHQHCLFVHIGET